MGPALGPQGQKNGRQLEPIGLGAMEWCKSVSFAIEDSQNHELYLYVSSLNMSEKTLQLKEEDEINFKKYIKTFKSICLKESIRCGPFGTIAGAAIV